MDVRNCVRKIANQQVEALLDISFFIIAARRGIEADRALRLALERIDAEVDALHSLRDQSANDVQSEMRGGE